MRVMTFNLRSDFILDINNRWKNRAEIVYEIIKKYNCDIIGVQELTDKMLEDLRKNLVDYNIVGSPRSKKIFIERNDILVSKKHKIIENSTFWLSSEPNTVGSSIWYSLYPRICTTALIELEDKTKIRVYNTHLDCLLPKAREYGLKKIGEMIEKQEDIDGLPSILMGDFNATPTSKLIKGFSEGNFSKKKFISVNGFKGEAYKMSTMSKFKGNKTGYHIDYIFVSEDFSIINSKIVDDNIKGKYPSDHYPIVAEIKI
ncbi:endonuclease/exonuclease/phosphatase family protein [Clostridium carnis]